MQKSTDALYIFLNVTSYVSRTINTVNVALWLGFTKLTHQ